MTDPAFVIEDNAERKLTLELNDNEARVMMVALGLLPLIVDSHVLERMLKSLKTKEQKLHLAMSGAALSGARHMSKIDEEMNSDALRANMERAHALANKVHDWIEDGEKHGDA